jgi:hypothetical protein
VKLAPLGGARPSLLAVGVSAAASGSAKLLNLAVEGLPDGEQEATVNAMTIPKEPVRETPPAFSLGALITVV